MSERLELRRGLEMDLRLALANNEFELYYQPILDAETLLPAGMEAALALDASPHAGWCDRIVSIPLAEGTRLDCPHWGMGLDARLCRCRNLA